MGGRDSYWGVLNGFVETITCVPELPLAVDLDSGSGFPAASCIYSRNLVCPSHRTKEIVYACFLEGLGGVFGFQNGVSPPAKFDRLTFYLDPGATP